MFRSLSSGGYTHVTMVIEAIDAKDFEEVASKPPNINSMWVSKQGFFGVFRNQKVALPFRKVLQHSKILCEGHRVCISSLPS